MSMKVVCVSGGFDPIHIGHLRMFKEAKKLGDKLIVILNQDAFLLKKKNFVFMPFEERKELIESIRCVDEVVGCIDQDQTVCETLRFLKPDIFANGGDRRNENDLLEAGVCAELGIEMVFNVGGGKISSSSDLVKKAAEVVKK
jgi:glycerol-3-phosphate cytidylyltransferase